MVKISKSVIGQKSETARAVPGLVFGLGPQKGRGLCGKRIVSEFVFPQVLISFINAIYTLYIYSYSQYGSIYSGLYSCSLGYIH